MKLKRGKTIYYYKYVLVVLILVLNNSQSLASAWQPWEQPTTSQQQTVEKISLNPLKQGVLFFQRYISVVDSPRCPMYPTCSAYALEALDKHGPILGSFLTVDRLLHESNPIEHKHPLTVYESQRFYDPLSANDFWLTPAVKD